MRLKMKHQWHKGDFEAQFKIKGTTKKQVAFKNDEKKYREVDPNEFGSCGHYDVLVAMLEHQHIGVFRYESRLWTRLAMKD